MSEGHTPGPWFFHSEIEREGPDERVWWSISTKKDPEEYGGEICSSDYMYSGSEVTGRSYANGLLIAAAPELYEALEELLRHAAFIGIAPHYDDLAEAALKKARGEQ